MVPLYCARMSTRIEVKTASEQHAEGIGHVIRDAIRRVNAKDYPPQEISRLLNNFSTAHILDFLKQRQILVAMSDQVVVGTGALQGAEIKSVFVSPDVQRKGVGTALVTELERKAVECGLQELVVSSSLSATKFYSALGYIEQRRNFFGTEETVVMIKPKISHAP